MKGLLSVISCPVCFNTLRAPVCLCTNGHGVCLGCRDALKHCPLCTKPFSASSSRSVLINDILCLLPHTCWEKGCEVLIKAGDDHATWCGYQETDCQVPSCEWTGCGKDILEHIKANHNKIIISETNSNWRLKEDLIDKDGLYFVNISIGVAQENYFWMFTKECVDKKRFVVDFIFFVPNGNIISNFQITLVLGDSKNSYSSSRTVIPKRDFLYSDIKMTFTSSTLEDLIDKEGFLSFSLKVAST